MSLIGWVGLEGLVCLMGIFFLFDLTQKYFQMELLSFMIHKNLMIPKPLVVQRSFQMEVWTLIIQRNSMITWYTLIQREFQLEVGTLIIQSQL